MTTVVLETENPNIRDLATIAKRGPVTVMQNNAPVAVVVSAEEFAKLDEDNRIRREAKVRLLSLMEDAGRQAEERGLTDEKLEQLLADES